MRGVFQKDKNDCVRACVASLFHLELDELPNFSVTGWDFELSVWLKDRNMGMINIKVDETSPDDCPRGYTLGGVPTMTDEFPPHYQHCVVCWEGKVVWCPKQGAMPGTERALEYTLIYPLNVFDCFSKTFLRNPNGQPDEVTITESK